MSRLGIAFSGGADPAEIVECVKLAETLGYESAWVAEGHGGDQFAVLSACAVQTSKILLGTSITSVFVRTMPTIAMAAATVDAISGGRFILGIGSSHKVQVEPEHGVPFRKPLTRVRESVEAIRALLRDGRVHYAGETVRIESFDLWFTPRRRAIPIYLSAVRPKMTALCGEIADGVILNFMPVEAVPRMLEHVRRGASRAGREASQLEIVSRFQTIVTDDVAAARGAIRHMMGPYFATSVYNRFVAWCGFPDEAAAILAGWQAKDRARNLAGVTDEMIDRIAVIGPAAHCRARLHAFAEAGVTTPMVHPFLFDEASIWAAFEQLAPG